MANDNVIAKVLDARKGKIGILQLDAEKTLNSLTLSMVKKMFVHLTDWEKDASIAAVILMGSGDKAFCAGGDVQQLYQSAKSQPGGPCEYGEAFFLNEYRLDYLLHTYSKPIICLGNGIVMGGGLGLMAGASHRVASETTRIAVPEITLGLFPDVGATSFLNKIPDHLGIFFALTGASINACDALRTGLANYLLAWDSHNQLIENLLDSHWSENAEANHGIVDKQLKALSLNAEERAKGLPSQISAMPEDILLACQQGSLSGIIDAIQHTETDNKWLIKARDTLASASPLSSVLIHEQLRRYRDADLRSVFLSELILATNMVRYPEFTEGVRALLIDKDNKPDWRFKHFSEVDPAVLEPFFKAPWPENPLAPYLIHNENHLQES